MRHCLTALLASATHVLFIGSALAGDVPNSALAQSLLVPPELLDNEALLFQFPQLSSAFDTQIFASANTSSFASNSEEDVGGNGRMGRSGVFVLSQEMQFFGSDVGNSRILQAGYGVRLGGARVGVAGRASRFRDRSEEIDLYEEGDRTQIRAIDTQINRWEAAVGAGLTRNRWFLDVAVELVREDLDIQGLDLDSRQDTVAVALESDTKPGTKVAARAGIPLGSSILLRAAGDYHDQSSEIQALRFTNGAVESDSETNYAHAWSTSLAIELARPSGSWRLFGTYANRRSPTSLLVRGFRASLEERLLEEDRAQIGLSFARTLFEDYGFMAGARTSWGRFENKVSRSEPNFESEDVDAEERMEQSFSWGLTREYRGLRLTGAMSTTLQLDNLFLALDASLRL